MYGTKMYGAEKAQLRGSHRVAAAFTAVIAVVVLGGCGSTQYQEPTHRWVSTDNSSSAEYRVDNTYCRREVAGDSSLREFEVNSPEYEKYTACMQARGYALTAYNDAPVR